MILPPPPRSPLLTVLMGVWTCVVLAVVIYRLDDVLLRLVFGAAILIVIAGLVDVVQSYREMMQMYRRLKDL